MTPMRRKRRSSGSLAVVVSALTRVIGALRTRSELRPPGECLMSPLALRGLFRSAGPNDRWRVPSPPNLRLVPKRINGSPSVAMRATDSVHSACFGLLRLSAPLPSRLIAEDRGSRSLWKPWSGQHTCGRSSLPRTRPDPTPTCG